MPFLTSDDYKKSIKDHNLSQITESDNTIRTEAEIAAQEEMESYLNQRYDVADVFSQSGADRNPLIVMYLVDLVLYHIHSRITPRNVPQIRLDRYDMAITWLNKVNSGKITPNLPRATDGENEETDRTRFGSNDKLSHQW